MQDWNYLKTGDFEITIELSMDKWPSASALPGYWDQNREAMVAYLQQVHKGVKGNALPIIQKLSFLGIVKDPTGLALSGVSIFVNSRSIVVKTDEHGEFYRILVPGTYTITASLTGYNNWTQSVTVTSAAESLNFALEPLNVSTGN
jgi:hypothetical protein